MSKKKFLATALLSVSLLGAGVVSATEGNYDANTNIEAQIFDLEKLVGGEDLTITNAAKQSNSYEVKSVTSRKYDYRTDTYAQELVLTVTQKDENKGTVTPVANTAVYVSVAGKITAVKTDADGRVKLTFPSNFVVNEGDDVTVMFALDNNLDTRTVVAQAQTKVQTVSYVDGRIKVSHPTVGTYIKVLNAKGELVTAVTIDAKSAAQSVYYVNAGELAEGTVVEVYKDEAEAKKASYNNPTYLVRFTVSSEKDMHRVYNPNSGEHHYTTDENEYKTLVKLGWTYEGVAWKAPSAGQPVYRVYNPNTGDHHYTLDQKERNQLVQYGWTDEGVGFYSLSNTTVKNPTHGDVNNAAEKGVEIFRLYNPNAKGAGSHHYTKDSKEANELKALGWQYEGTAWWAVGK